MSRPFLASAETKISAGMSRVTGAAELNDEMGQYKRTGKKYFFGATVQVKNTAVLRFTGMYGQSIPISTVE